MTSSNPSLFTSPAVETEMPRPAPSWLLSTIQAGEVTSGSTTTG